MNANRRIAQVVVCVATAFVIGLIAFTIRSRSLSTTTANERNFSSSGPQLILWAWERPTDLRFINTNKIGVAFLAKSILLSGDDVRVRPRLQPLQVPAGSKIIAVTRIETDAKHEPSLSVDQRRAVIAAIADTASLPNVSEVQIDFDATKSERDFYRELIADVRLKVPAQIRFSITALASWCMHDDW